MQPPQNPYNQPPSPYSQQPFNPQAPYGPPPQMPRGKVSTEVISEGWQILSPVVGQWVLAMVVFFGIYYGIGIVRSIIETLGRNGGSQIWTILALLIQLVSWIVVQLMTGGLAKMAIATVRTRTADIGQMWSVSNVGMTLVLSALLQGILSLLVCLPGIAVLGVNVFLPLFKAGVFNPAVLASGRPPAIPPSLIGGMMGGIFGGIALILVATIPLRALLFLATLLIVDRKVGPWAAIAQSAGALKKHFWSALLVVLLTDLVNLAGVLACCVGTLVSVPLTQIAIALVYRDLFGLGDAAPQPQTIYAPPPIANPNF